VVTDHDSRGAGPSAGHGQAWEFKAKLVARVYPACRRADLAGLAVGNRGASGKPDGEIQVSEDLCTTWRTPPGPGRGPTGTGGPARRRPPLSTKP
jgi:hypothetical protein